MRPNCARGCAHCFFVCFPTVAGKRLLSRLDGSLISLRKKCLVTHDITHSLDGMYCIFGSDLPDERRNNTHQDHDPQDPYQNAPFPRLPAKTLPWGSTDSREVSRHPPSGGARAIITQYEPAVTVA